MWAAPEGGTPLCNGPAPQTKGPSLKANPGGARNSRQRQKTGRTREASGPFS